MPPGADPSRALYLHASHAFRYQQWVESRNGAVRGLLAVARFRSPLIKPDVRISRIRLSD
jgi:hypothetical protein